MPRAKRSATDDPAIAPAEPLTPSLDAPPEAPKRRTTRKSAADPAVTAPEVVEVESLVAPEDAAPEPAGPVKRARSPRAAKAGAPSTESVLAAETASVTAAPAMPSRKRSAEQTEPAPPAATEAPSAPVDSPRQAATPAGEEVGAPIASLEPPSRPPRADEGQPEPIASLENERVRLIRSLHEKRHREEHGAFIIEGVRLVEEALSSGAEIPLVLYDPEAVARNSRARQLIEALGDAAVPVTDRVLRSVADTQNPQGVVGMVRVPEPAEAAPSGRLVVVLDAVQDPGNVGTILRAAVASGVNSVIVGPDCADVYSPKVVRAGMGAHFHIDLFTDLDWPQIERLTAGRQRLVGAPVGGRVYYQVDWTRPSALVISNEGAGPSLGAMRLAGGQGNGKVSIPIVGPADSLNAAVAAGILLFEASRQASERRGQMQDRGSRQDRNQRPNLGRNTPFRDGPPQRDGGWRPGFDRQGSGRPQGGRPFGGGQGGRPYPPSGPPRRPNEFDDEPPFRGGAPRGGRGGGGRHGGGGRPPFRGGGGRER